MSLSCYHPQRLFILTAFSPPNYLHSRSGQLVTQKKQLDNVCNIETIPVDTGTLKSPKNKLPYALKVFADEFTKLGSEHHLGVVCLVIPYVTFSDKIRFYRMCICHTPAGYDGKPDTVVGIAQVVIKPGTDCAGKLKSQACAEGLVYSPTWHCGYSEELQACFTPRELLCELIPVLQQLELATTNRIRESYMKFFHHEQND